VRDDRTEGLSAVGNGGQAAVSLMSDVDGTGSGSLLVLLYSIQHCTLKYIKAPPLVEDAHTWQGLPGT